VEALKELKMRKRTEQDSTRRNVFLDKQNVNLPPPTPMIKGFTNF
jgi:hypothetical protein